MLQKEVEHTPLTKMDAAAAFLASLEEPKLTSLAEAGKKPPIEILPPGMPSLDAPISLTKKAAPATQNTQQPGKPLLLEGATATTVPPSTTTTPSTGTATTAAADEASTTTTAAPQPESGEPVSADTNSAQSSNSDQVVPADGVPESPTSKVETSEAPPQVPDTTQETNGHNTVTTGDIPSV